MRLLRYMLPYTGIFLFSIFGYLLFMLSRAGAVKLMERIQVWLAEPPEFVFYYLPIAVVLLFALQGIGSFVGGYFLAVVSVRMEERLRGDLMGQLLTSPLQRLRSYSTGDVVNRITFTSTRVTGAGADALRTVLRDGITAIGLLTYLFYLNWQLTLVLIVLAPPVALVIGVVSSMFRRYSRNIQGTMGRLTQVSGEVIRNFPVVKALRAEGRERDRFARHNAFARRQSLKVQLVKWISTPMLQLMMALGLAAQLGLMGYAILHGDMQPEGFMAYLTAAALLASPVRQLTMVNSLIQQGIAAAQDIFHSLDEPPEKDSGGHSVERVSGRIEFRDVDFSYLGGGEQARDPRQIFSGFNLTIESGEVVALVGPSGAGKTTLTQFLLRFIEPNSGQVLLDGVPLDDYSLECLRRQVGIVDQQVSLFNDTVYNNLCYGALRDSTPEAVREALRISGADEFVYELPQGVHTEIGEGGQRLSGGQRQRLALARALLQDAPVLILDEATSSLDSLSERYIQKGLERLIEGRTTIIIAHRLSTIEGADRILVLDEGRIVESGTHAELLDAGGLYGELHRHQFGRSQGQASTETPQPQPAVPDDAAGEAPAPGMAPVQPGETSGFIQKMWHSRSWMARALSPLGHLNAARARRQMRNFAAGRADVWRAPIPVVVIGNLTAGGTGKTPVVSELARVLHQAGYRPGVVSRGYVPGHASPAPYYPFRVQPDSDPAEVGDEAVMLARQGGVPVSVGPDRPAAVRALINECDVILSDDGLQHYALGRDVEIVVVDGVRGFGNGLCMPAGPLREPIERLDSVDWVLCNGAVPLTGHERELCFHLAPSEWLHLASGETHPIQEWPSAARAHCVAGLGNPERFFASVKGLGIEVIRHAYPDHHRYRGSEVDFDDDLPVITTEKDAVKWGGFIDERMWVLRVQPQGLEPLNDWLLRRLPDLRRRTA
ncbi:MAG: lipid A export permease/ATP-binding protein MsbA [Gammaproteobacteria bacterium AqS3]|nr:lipid A export permease/ATP-binding protein MsbA [Gammaproteobacteria bacterium AqS3]